MTATVHKILVQSKDILEQTVLPVGYFGEVAAESRNKIYRAMDTSDPIISPINLKRRVRKHKRLSLPPEIIQM